MRNKLIFEVKGFNVMLENRGAFFSQLHESNSYSGYMRELTDFLKLNIIRYIFWMLSSVTSCSCILLYSNSDNYNNMFLKNQRSVIFCLGN